MAAEPGPELADPGAARAVADAALEDAPCPMGCARDDEELFVGRDRFYGRPGAFPVVRCRICQLCRSNPRPTMETIGSYYPDRYGPYHRAEKRHGRAPPGSCVSAVSREPRALEAAADAADAGAGGNPADRADEDLGAGRLGGSEMDRRPLQ